MMSQKMNRWRNFAPQLGKFTTQLENNIFLTGAQNKGK